MSPLALLVLLAPAREDFTPTWQAVESAIRRGYYAREKRHDEMDRLLAKYAPTAKSAPDRDAFAATIESMVGEFHDSHFDFLTDKDQGYYLMDCLSSGGKAAPMANIGAWFKKSPDGYTVQMVLEGGAAEKAGLRVGDLITTLDGAPFTPVESLRKVVGRPVKLAYRRGTEPGEADVTAKSSTALKMFLDATLISERTIERNGKKIGYLHLWTQASEEFQNALTQALATRFKDVDGFILDLRAGFGGRVAGFGEPLTKANFPKPLTVLIDRGSRSAKELLSFQLQRSGRAKLVGETTAGNVLGASPQRINAWSYLEIPVVDIVVGGVRLEGRGVSPDVPVPTEAGKDLPLDRAVDLLTAPRL